MDMYMTLCIWFGHPPASILLTHVSFHIVIVTKYLSFNSSNYRVWLGLFDHDLKQQGDPHEHDVDAIIVVSWSWYCLA